MDNIPELSVRHLRALVALARHGAGASAFYPSALSRLEPLRPHLADSAPMPGAEELAARLFTLPVHGRLRGARWRGALAALHAIG